MPATVASEAVSHGGNLKHSHTLKIRRPSVLTPGKYPAPLSQLRILRSNYEYGSFLDEDGRTDWFTVAYNVATVAPCIPEWSSFKDEKDYDALSEVIAHLWKQSQDEDEDEDGDERDDDEDIPAHLPQPSEWSGGVLQLSEEQVDFGKSRSFWSALKSVSTSKRAGIYRLYRCVVATLPVGVVP